MTAVTVRHRLDDARPCKTTVSALSLHRLSKEQVTATA